jgi:hypothetical protein
MLTHLPREIAYLCFLLLWSMSFRVFLLWIVCVIVVGWLVGWGILVRILRCLLLILFFLCFLELFWVILSCTVPLPSAVRPPAVPFKVVFWMGVGWCMKSSMYGVTHQDAPESIMACDVSFVHMFVSISMAILSSSLFCKFDLFHRGKSSCSSDAASCWYTPWMFGGVIRKCVRWNVRSSVSTSKS